MAPARTTPALAGGNSTCVARALKALNESRWNDARKHVDALDASVDNGRVWQPFLRGELLFRCEQLAPAEPDLLRAVAEALALALGADPASVANARKGPSESETHGPPALSRGDAFRLAAAAVERTGVISRRFERLDAAVRAHSLAYGLRTAFGSLEEQWESAISLAIDAELRDTPGDAVGWSRRAIALAEGAAQGSLKKQVVAWTHLGRGLTRSPGGLPPAVDAFRRALELQRRSDPSVVDVPRAQLRLGHALVRHAEALIDPSRDASAPPPNGPDPTAAGSAAAADPDPARHDVVAIVREAVDQLGEARDSLLAFGRDAGPDADEASRLLDFATRLLAGIE